MTPLEEVLVSPRIMFMKIYALGCDRQFGIKGGVVNVPLDVPKMFESIPIRPDQTETIQLKLKRMLKFKHEYMYETIRPVKVWEAASYLVTTPLYKKENVTLDIDWMNSNIVQFISEEDDTEDAPIEPRNQLENNLENQFEDESSTSPSNEEVIRQPLANDQELEDEEICQETLLECRDGIEIAPGEGQIPLGILMDENCEELAFCSVWCGHARSSNPDVKISFEDHVNSKIRRRDRRAVRPDHILFLNKKSQTKQLASAINIALKKTVGGKMTASEALDQAFINEKIAKDNAFRILGNITGSPAYWEKQKKNVLAMEIQLPTTK